MKWAINFISIFFILGFVNAQIPDPVNNFRAFSPFNDLVPSGSDPTTTLLNDAELWIMASDVDTPSDGSSVTTLTAHGSSLYTFTEATNKPIYKASIINGQPVIRFDGTNDKMECSSGFLPKTLFAVVKPIALGNWLSWYGCKSTTAGAWDSYLLGNSLATTTASWRVGYGTGSSNVTAISTGVLSNGTPVLYMVTLDTSGGNINTTIKIDGTAGSPGSVSSQTVKTADGPQIIGAGYYNDAVVDFANYDVAEIIGWDRALDGTEEGLAQTYLADKYNITVP